MKELTCFLILIIIVVIYMNYLRKPLHLTKVKSNVNDREYYVRNLKDKQDDKFDFFELDENQFMLLIQLIKVKNYLSVFDIKKLMSLLI